MRSRRARSTLLLLAKLAVTLGLLGWLGAQIAEREGIDSLAARLESLDPGWLAAAVGLHAAAVLAGVLRWRLLLTASGIELSFGWLARSFLVGRFVGAFTPSTAGLDGWRLWESSRESGDAGRSAAAIVVEKLVGLVGMAAVCGALVPFGGVALLGRGALVIALAMSLGAALGLALLRRPALLGSLASRAPRFARARLERAIEALASTRLDARGLGGAVALGVLSHLSLSAVFWATAGSLHLPVSGGEVLAVGNAIVLAVLLPVSIGGVGVREGVAAVLLSRAGIDSSDAVLVALLGYLTGQVPALVGGVLFASRRSTGEATVSPEPAPPPLAAGQTLS
jgi:hypothetical protein